MTLKDATTAISALAKQQKIINYAAAGADVTELNFNTVDSYPALFIAPTGSHTVKKDTTIYRITIFYLDRLLNDNQNMMDILSVSVEQLKNIVKGINLIEGVVNVDFNYEITNFTETEAMNDKVAGGYANIDMELVNDTTCYTN